MRGVRGFFVRDQNHSGDDRDSRGEGTKAMQNLNHQFPNELIRIKLFAYLSIQMGDGSQQGNETTGLWAEDAGNTTN